MPIFCREELFQPPNISIFRKTMGTSYDISLCIDYKLSDCPIQQSISRPRNTRCGLFNSTGLEPTQQLCEPTILHNSQSLKNSKSAKSVCDINSAVLEVKAMASDVKVNVSMLPNQNSELHPNVHQHGSTTGTFKNIQWNLFAWRVSGNRIWKTCDGQTEQHHKSN